MSRENVELVERATRAASARPKPDYATMNELYAPDHVLIPAAGRQIEGQGVGAEGFRSWRQAVDEVFEVLEFEFDSAVDVAPNKVLAGLTIRYSGRQSGATSEQRMWNLVTIRDGKITRTEAFTDPVSAVRASLER